MRLTKKEGEKMEKDIKIGYDFHVKYEGVETIGKKNYYKVSTKGLLCNKGKDLAQIDYLYLEKKGNKYKIVFSEIKFILHSAEKFPLYGVNMGEFLAKISALVDDGVTESPNKKILNAKTVMRRKEKKMKRQRKKLMNINKKMTIC
jgi:hypothetical protein